MEKFGHYIVTMNLVSCLLVSCLFSLFKDQFSLEQICGGSVFASHDKCINMLVNFILPLCIRLGCARKGIKSTCYEFLEILKLLSFMYRIIHVLLHVGIYMYLQ